MTPRIFHKKSRAALARLDRTGSCEPVRAVRAAPAPHEVVPEGLRPLHPRHNARLKVKRSFPTLHIAPKPLPSDAALSLAAALVPGLDQRVKAEQARALVRSQWVIMDGEPMHVCDIPYTRVPRRVRDAVRAAQHAARKAGRVEYDPRAQVHALSGFHAQFTARPAAPLERDCVSLERAIYAQSPGTLKYELYSDLSKDPSFDKDRYKAGL